MPFVLALCYVAVRHDVLPTTYLAFASLLFLLLLCFALFAFALVLAAVYGYKQPAVNRQLLASISVVLGVVLGILGGLGGILGGLGALLERS